MMAVALTILIILGVFAAGYFIFEDEDDRNDTWRGF